MAKHSLTSTGDDGGDTVADPGMTGEDQAPDGVPTAPAASTDAATADTAPADSAPAASAPTGPRPEPVSIASAVQAVLAAAVTLGWLNLDSVTVATIGTVVAAVIAAVTTLIARSRVTPVKDPRDNTGKALTP